MKAEAGRPKLNSQGPGQAAGPGGASLIGPGVTPGLVQDEEVGEQGSARAPEVYFLGSVKRAPPETKRHECPCARATWVNLNPGVTCIQLNDQQGLSVVLLISKPTTVP